MGGVVLEGKGRKCPPICPVTGHPPRTGTRLPTAPGRNKLLNSHRDKKCYLFPALSVGRWGLSGQPPAASTSSCEEAEGGRDGPLRFCPRPRDVPPSAFYESIQHSPCPEEKVRKTGDGYGFTPSSNSFLKWDCGQGSSLSPNFFLCKMRVIIPSGAKRSWRLVHSKPLTDRQSFQCSGKMGPDRQGSNASFSL